MLNITFADLLCQTFLRHAVIKNILTYLLYFLKNIKNHNPALKYRLIVVSAHIECKLLYTIISFFNLISHIYNNP